MQSKIKVSEMEIVPVDFNQDKGGRKYKGKEEGLVCLYGQKACRVWQEPCLRQQLWPQLYILRWCLNSAPGFLSPALMFSIRGDHKLLSTVITDVHCGSAEGSQPVLVHQVTTDGGTSDMITGKDLRAGLDAI